VTKHRVLLVDDEPALRRSLERALKLAGYDVRTAADADSAYAILQELSVDAALLDLRMPQLTGDALAVAMLHRWPYLVGRIILMSGDPFAAREAWPGELQNCPVLGKPFSLEALGDAIRSVIHEAELKALRPRARNGHE
jgi:DNA-binding NtrC family response regulator